MLIKTIIMLLRKKTQLRIAYALLATTAISILVFDAERRSDSALRSAQSPTPTPCRVAPTAPLLPLAQSPFTEADLDNFLTAESAPARPGAKAAVPDDHRSTPSGVYFLKVAMEVPSKNGPIALTRGTRVHLVREQDGKLRVRRKTTDFLIEKSQVTDDLNVLAVLARNSS